MDDEQIIDLFFRRDEQAIVAFEDRYKELCLSVAFAILGDHGRSEECVSGVCLRLWNAIPPEHPHSLKAYCVRITRNVALHYLEKENARKRSAVLVELSECVSEETPDMEEGRSRASSTNFWKHKSRSSRSFSFDGIIITRTSAISRASSVFPRIKQAKFYPK